MLSFDRNGSVGSTSGPAPGGRPQGPRQVGGNHEGRGGSAWAAAPRGAGGCRRQALPTCQVFDSETLKFSWQVTVEDFEIVCKGLYRALCIREKYMQRSYQRFPKTPSKYLRSIEGQAWVANENFYPGKSFSSIMYRLHLTVQLLNIKHAPRWLVSQSENILSPAHVSNRLIQFIQYFLKPLLSAPLPKPLFKPRFLCVQIIAIVF